MKNFNSTTLFPPDFFFSNKSRSLKPSIRYLEPLPEIQQEPRHPYKIIVTSPKSHSQDPMKNSKLISSLSCKHLRNSLDPFQTPPIQPSKKNPLKTRLPHLKPLVHNSIFSPRLSQKSIENRPKDFDKHLTVTFSQKSFKVLNQINNR
ncbi:unnamed protein product [Blepharisma stoltei]|uniref:Uncharacterized protein n=1 Tax=Blepharisma stoltei TaxID=1481888 RepID=A0AAU9IGK2_9CILI|nr:unnamed protein product [Blepharisma stoltei]